MNSVKFIFPLLFTLSSPLQGQNIQKMTLMDVVEWAQQNSLSGSQAKTLKSSGHFRYRGFKAGQNPQLSLNGTLPGFTRSFSPVTQPDGTIISRSISNNSSNLDLNLSQAITATGGQVFVNSSIQRFDAFNNDFTQFNTTPMRVGLIQPLFGFNTFKWNRLIEPLIYRESDKRYVEDVERLSSQTTQLFFDQFIAKINIEIATTNLANNDTIYQIAQGRFNLGNIGENQLLQLELAVMNAQIQLEQANLDFETSGIVLKSFIGFDQSVDLDLDLPNQIPLFQIDERLALDEAHKNRQDYTAFERRRLEAEREVARAKGNSGFSADLFASFGLTNSAETFSDSYNNPQDQQSVNLGFSIPILDWGQGKSSVKNAQILSELENYRISEDRMNFDQNILVAVRQFESLKNRVAVTQKSDDIAQRRYNIAKQRYLIGKTGITDLSIAAQEKDAAKRNYIRSLRNFWLAYYEIRALTLYDFQNGASLYLEQENR